MRTAAPAAVIRLTLLAARYPAVAPGTPSSSVGRPPPPGGPPHQVPVGTRVVGVDDRMAAVLVPVQGDAGVVHVAAVGEEEVRAALEVVPVRPVAGHHRRADAALVECRRDGVRVDQVLAARHVDHLVQQADAPAVTEERQPQGHVQLLAGLW
jgi:hypothetical protein